MDLALDFKIGCIPLLLYVRDYTNSDMLVKKIYRVTVIFGMIRIINRNIYHNIYKTFIIWNSTYP